MVSSMVSVAAALTLTALLLLLADPPAALAQQGRQGEAAPRLQTSSLPDLPAVAQPKQQQQQQQLVAMPRQALRAKERPAPSFLIGTRYQPLPQSPLQPLPKPLPAQPVGNGPSRAAEATGRSKVSVTCVAGPYVSIYFPQHNLRDHPTYLRGVKWATHVVSGLPGQTA